MAKFGRNDFDAILKRLESKNYRTAREKRELLNELKTYPARPDVMFRFVTGPDPELARFAVQWIHTCRDSRLIDQLLKVLPRSPRGRMRPIIEAIHGLRSPVLGDRLDRMLRSQQLEARAVALEVLATAPDWKQHLGLVKLALKDSDRAVRVQAVRILGQDPRDPHIRSLLGDLLYALDNDLRHTAIEVLARNPDASIIEDFFDLLPNQPPKLQEIMIRGLRQLLSGGNISERVLEMILPLLAADDTNVRQAAAQLLASMPNKLHVMRRFLIWAKGIAFWLRDRSFSTVATIAGDVTEAILTLMEDKDLDVVVGAVAMTERSRDPRLVDGLATLLDADYDWWIRIPALEHLAEFDHPRVHDVLVAKLADDALRNAAIVCLGKRGDAKALPHLLRYLSHPRKGARKAALDALVHFKDLSLLEPLERIARTDPDYECRHAALEMLDGYGPEGVSIAAAVRGEHARGTPDNGGEELKLTMLRKDLE